MAANGQSSMLVITQLTKAGPSVGIYCGKHTQEYQQGHPLTLLLHYLPKDSLPVLFCGGGSALPACGRMLSLSWFVCRYLYDEL